MKFKLHVGLYLIALCCLWLAASDLYAVTFDWATVGNAGNVGVCFVFCCHGNETVGVFGRLRQASATDSNYSESAGPF